MFFGLEFLTVGRVSFVALLDGWNQRLEVFPVAAVQGVVRLRYVHLHPARKNKPSGYRH